MHVKYYQYDSLYRFERYYNPGEICEKIALLLVYSYIHSKIMVP